MEVFAQPLAHLRREVLVRVRVRVRIGVRVRARARVRVWVRARVRIRVRTLTLTLTLTLTTTCTPRHPFQTPPHDQRALLTVSSSAVSLVSKLRDARRAIAASSTALQFRVSRTSATSHLTFALGFSIVLYRYDAAECRPLPSALLGATDDLLAAGPHNGKSCFASHAAFATSSLLSTTAEEIGAARRQ